MELALIALGLLSCLEVALWLPGFWRFRKPLAAILVVALSLVTGLLLAVYFKPWAVLVTVFSLYRMVNLLRLVQGRIHTDYLYHAARRTSIWLIGMQLAIVVAARLADHAGTPTIKRFYALVTIQLIAVLVLLASTLRHLRHIQPPKIQNNYADRDLPAVTVAIPARNETEDLEACLQSLVASNYPKLEILVLDDCSQNKRTPEIIRNFAHAGVRFVAGKVPPEDWLAKNYAYSQLAEEANGEVLLFCGVDCRFEQDSVSALIKTMLGKKKAMLSILPVNTLKSPLSLEPLLVQPSRYAWELALPRKILKRPPVLSTCWLITRDALEAAGSFAAVSRKSVPESYFAKATANKDDGYSFLKSTPEQGITSIKNFEEQRETAIRTRYPQLHRRPELIAMIALAEFIVLVWPLILAVSSAVAGEWILAILSGAAFLLAAILHSKIINLTYRRFLPLGILILPVAALYDIGLLNYSMWLYEFREVIWKGRNVCIPVMRAIPSLPRIT